MFMEFDPRSNVNMFPVEIHPIRKQFVPGRSSGDVVSLNSG